MIFVGRTALSVDIMTNVSTPVPVRGARKIPGSDYVVSQRLDDVCFHHRHVFVGGRVKHYRNRVPAHYFMHGRIVPDVSDTSDELEIRKALPQLHFDAEEIAFGLIENNQTFRREIREFGGKVLIRSNRRRR